MLQPLTFDCFDILRPTKGLDEFEGQDIVCFRSQRPSTFLHYVMSHRSGELGAESWAATGDVVISKTFLDVRVDDAKSLARRNSWPCFQPPQVEAFKVTDLQALKSVWFEEQKEKSLAKKEASHREGRCFPCLFFTRKGDGCRQGDSCTHCHICTIGEARRRRNRISLEMRKAKRQARKMDVDA